MKKAFLISCLIVLVAPNFAVASEKPSACPSVSLLKALGFLGYDFGPDDHMYGINMSNYGQEGLWGFIFGPLKAETKEEAAVEAKPILQQLSGDPTPALIDPDVFFPNTSLKFGSKLVWTCVYNAPGVKAAAFYDILNN